MFEDLLIEIAKHSQPKHDTFVNGDRAIVIRNRPTTRRISVKVKPSYCIGSIGVNGFYWISCDEPNWRPF